MFLFAISVLCCYRLPVCRPELVWVWYYVFLLGALVVVGLVVKIIYFILKWIGCKWAYRFPVVCVYGLAILNNKGWDLRCRYSFITC